jgi:hypothetical protein
MAFISLRELLFLDEQRAGWVDVMSFNIEKISRLISFKIVLLKARKYFGTK